MTLQNEWLPRMSPDEYLNYENSQDIRHELVDGYLQAMPVVSDKHEKIALNLLASLRADLRGSTSKAYKGDLKIRQRDNFYYPDVFVCYCEEPDDPCFKKNPVLVAEVLSPSTQRYDQGNKRMKYWCLPSLQEYVLIWQDTMRVELTRRDEADTIVLEHPKDVLVLNSVICYLTLADLYL